MIKRVFSLTLIILILLLVFQFVINFFKTEHYVEYALKVEDKDYKIVETYKKSGSDDYYLFDVKVDEYSFLIERQNDFNKQKEIVTDIKSYEKDDVFCISLVFTDNEEESMPVCSKNGQIYSYLALANDYNFDEFLSSIPNYKKQLLKENSKVLSVSDLSVYDDNQYQDETLLVYNYQNIIRITKNYDDVLSFSSFDEYKNELGRLVGKYYLIPQNTVNPEYSVYLAFDVTTQLTRKMKLDEKISKQMYVNGIYDDKLYIFDKSNLIQYAVDPYDKEVEVIGTKYVPAFMYKNGKKEEVTVYDLNNVMTFTEDVSEYEDIEYDNIFVTTEYAIYYKDNSFYKVYKNFKDRPILLFSANDVKEVKFISDRIYYINDNILYRYDERGLVPLIKREEFKYNYLNIYDIYVED